MNKKQLLIIVSVVVIALCVINMARQMSGGGRRGFAPTGVQNEVGKALAGATAAELGNSGSVAILVRISCFSTRQDQAGENIQILRIVF